MGIDWSLKIIYLIILLAGSAFFSGSEVALFSINKRKINSQFKGHKLIIKYVKTLIEKPRRLLVTILIGNTVVNVAASIVAVTLAIDLSVSIGVKVEIMILIQIILLTILILIFGELIPKVIASKSPVSFTKVVILPLYWISVLIYPISEIITELIKAATSKINIHKVKTVLTKDEISEMTDIGQEKGTLEQEEQNIIKSIVSFKNITASEVMTPRVDINAISLNKSFEDVVAIINETGHSRFPLFRENMDKIIGILHAKDILPFLKSNDLSGSEMLSSIARKAIFIPGNKKISDLLRDFQNEKTHIAIVVDEYGGTAGLITLEDVIEEVVGEIWDEYDTEEDMIKKIDNDHYLVMGKTTIEEMNETIRSNIVGDDLDFETVGGLIFKQAGLVPKEGYNFTLNNYKFTVKEIHRKRIKKVLIERVIIN